MGLLHSVRFGFQTLSLQRKSRHPIDEIRRIQRSRLQALVRNARDQSDFYRKKFTGIPPSQFELTDLPVSKKSELMEDFDSVVTVPDIHREDVERFVDDDANLGKYFLGKYVLSHTSGSQGQPLLLVQPKANLELLFALQASRGNYRNLGLKDVLRRAHTPARLAAVTLTRGFYPSAIAFEYIPEPARRYIELLRVSSTEDDMLELLQDFRPTHMTTYASVLRELARATENGALSLKPELEQIVNIGECLMPQAREAYADVFGARVLDDYAMGECPHLSNGCAEGGGMHVNADWAILEVVDEEYRSVPAGQQGRKVLVTNLANYVQPIIRYEVDDLVTMAATPCGCGSQLPLIERIEGRSSDIFQIEDEDGVHKLPATVFQHAFNYVTGAREFQIIQEDDTGFRILIEPLTGAHNVTDQVREAIRKELSRHDIGDRLSVNVEIVDQLARPEGHAKYKRVVVKPSAPSTHS